MASISLRPLLPARSQRTVETLRAMHTSLVFERQQLRSEGAHSDDLERNRLAIVRCQWELSRALIERYLSPPTASNAA
jgi:hypothetical protein